MARLARECWQDPALADELAPSRLDAVQKSARLRVCTPGDYTPFALQKQEGAFEGLDVDLVQSAARSLGAEAVFVKSAWPTLMKDFIEKCDVAVGGISVTLDRQKTAFFSQAYMVNGKAPITRCENVAKFQTIADIDKPTVTVIENPGGSNERFARANFKSAKIVIYNDNTDTPSASATLTLTIHDNTGSYVVPSGSQLVSESGAGAPNGVINSNETVQVLFGFRDAGGLWESHRVEDVALYKRCELQDGLRVRHHRCPCRRGGRAPRQRCSCWQPARPASTT